MYYLFSETAWHISYRTSENGKNNTIIEYNRMEKGDSSPNTTSQWDRVPDRQAQNRDMIDVCIKFKVMTMNFFLYHNCERSKHEWWSCDKYEQEEHRKIYCTRVLCLSKINVNCDKMQQIEISDNGCNGMFSG